MPARRFVLLTLTVAAGCFALAHAAHVARSRSVDNVQILAHQLAKLEDPAHRDTRIVILGDSAAGAAMHAPTFSALSGTPTQNLALTGSFGFMGDYALMQRAKQTWPELQTVILMHTLDIWRRRTSPTSLVLVDSPGVDFSLVRGGERIWLERLKVEINLKEIEWYLKDLFSRPRHVTFSPVTDFAAQGGALFATGERTIDPGESLRTGIHPDKRAMFVALDRMAARLGLNVIYVHAPIHEVLAQNSGTVIEEINAVVSSAHTLHALTDVTAYPNEMMGNTTDHVYEPLQREVTRHYFELLRDHLAGD